MERVLHVGKEMGYPRDQSEAESSMADQARSIGLNGMLWLATGVGICPVATLSFGWIAEAFLERSMVIYTVSSLGVSSVFVAFFSVLVHFGKLDKSALLPAVIFLSSRA